MKINRFDEWWNSKLKAYRRRNVFHKFFKFCSWDKIDSELAACFTNGNFKRFNLKKKRKTNPSTLPSYT